MDEFKYFVGGLDISLRDDDLKNYFTSIGIDVIMPKVLMSAGVSR